MPQAPHVPRISLVFSLMSLFLLRIPFRGHSPFACPIPLPTSGLGQFLRLSLFLMKLGSLWSIGEGFYRMTSNLGFDNVFLCLDRGYGLWGASQVALVVRNLIDNAGDIRGTGLIPGLGRSPGGGHSNPLQCSCLGNPMDRGAWWAIVDGFAKSQT